MVRSTETSPLRLGPVELVVLQGTPFCNLSCTYCCLTSESRRRKGSMSPELIERVFSELFASPFIGERLVVSWHAGEPLSLPPAYYESAIATIQALRRRLAPESLALRFHIQTNGVLIDEAWCDFFTRHADVLDIGLSCDGPRELHDRHRLNWAGKPSFDRTSRGMALLAAYGIKYHLIAVVSPESLRCPERFVDFFAAKRHEISGFHFNFLSDVTAGSPVHEYDEPAANLHYEFIRRVLERLRLRGDDPPLKVRNLAQLYAKLFAPEELRDGNSARETSYPLRTLNVDVEGNVTTFHAGLYVDVLPDAYGDGMGFGIGNIQERSLQQLAGSEKLSRLIGDFEASHSACERDCRYAPLCSGGYEIAKKKRFGTLDVAETPECRLHVKPLVDAVLDDLEGFMETRSA